MDSDSEDEQTLQLQQKVIKKPQKNKIKKKTTKYLFKASFSDANTFKGVITALGREFTFTNLIFTQSQIIIYENEKSNVSYLWTIYAKEKLLEYKSAIESSSNENDPERNESERESALMVNIKLKELLNSIPKTIKGQGIILLMEESGKTNRIKIQRTNEDNSTSYIETYPTKSNEFRSFTDYEDDTFRFTNGYFSEIFNEAAKKKCDTLEIKYDPDRNLVAFVGYNASKAIIFEKGRVEKIDPNSCWIFEINNKTIRALSGSKNMCDDGDIIKFYFEEDKDLKIMIPTGSFATLEIYIQRKIREMEKPPKTNKTKEKKNSDIKKKKSEKISLM